MAVDINPASWTTRAEAAIRSLPQVEGVRIDADGDDIRVIHVLTSSKRPAKQIVRDVQTLLATRFDRLIDHRIVSVVAVAAGEAPTLAPAAVPPMSVTPLGVAEGPGAGVAAESGKGAADDGRIRFGSVNLYVSGPRAQAQVELKWKQVVRMGSASGWSTRDGAQRLIAAATLAALQEYIDEETALGILEVELVRMGRNEVAVVTVSMLAHRQEKTLVGCCTVEQDMPQAVVLATLAALNRVVGGLRTKEPTEYVLRPTST